MGISSCECTNENKDNRERERCECHFTDTHAYLKQINDSHTRVRDGRLWWIDRHTHKHGGLRFFANNVTAISLKKKANKQLDLNHRTTSSFARSRNTPPRPRPRESEWSVPQKTNEESFLHPKHHQVKSISQKTCEFEATRFAWGSNSASKKIVMSQISWGTRSSKRTAKIHRTPKREE